ncbi:uncharacterized protein LOC118145468 isoform X2 [Callithrix jacchus]
MSARPRSSSRMHAPRTPSEGPNAPHSNRDPGWEVCVAPSVELHGHMYMVVRRIQRPSTCVGKTVVNTGFSVTLTHSNAQSHIRSRLLLAG